MSIFVVFKVARQELGEFVFVSAEKAFQTNAGAEAYFAAKAKEWQENIQGTSCHCYRAIHEVELE